MMEPAPSQDGDLWGYQMEGRHYATEETNYKFTGKERDNESKYDYFGARYYDSRIGRWGSVEPLMEKYRSYTPYQYGMLNPLKLADVNGKDAKVTIDNSTNTINVQVDIYYKLGEAGGPQDSRIDEDQLGTAERLLGVAEDKWNDAGESVDIDGVEYNVKFSINLIDAKAKSNNDVSDSFDFDSRAVGEGKNYFDWSANPSHNPAVKSGNTLRFINTIGREMPTNWVEHEVGHLIGLNHPPGTKAELKLNKNVMAWHRRNNPPTADDVKKFINENVDLTKEEQIVRGVEREEGSPAK